MNQAIRIVMFSGGRGTGALTKALLKYPDIYLTLLVNTYDDGLSTGMMRRFIPGMLGPSDVRKNISTCLSSNADAVSKALQTLLEYRFSKTILADEAERVLQQYTVLDVASNSDHELLRVRSALSLHVVQKLALYCKAFLDYYHNHIASAPWFTFQDASFGNIVFAGCYLFHHRNFNKAVSELVACAGIKGSVLNVTDGANKVLTAIKEDGEYLHDEAAIVSPQSNKRIEEVFLLDDYLESRDILSGEKERDIATLRAMERLPEMGIEAKNAIDQADIIIYGPGTQYSSLLPTYLTVGMAEAIQRNERAEKVFIANIARDYDIMGETAVTLIRSFIANMSRKGAVVVEPNKLISQFFFQRPETSAHSETPYVDFNASDFEYSMDKVRWIDFEGDTGKHAGNKTIDEVLRVVEEKRQEQMPYAIHKVSFVVPVLNESKTIDHALSEIVQLDFQKKYGLDKEVIVVDGGSTDGTLQKLQSRTDIRLYTCPHGSGRGQASRLGIEKVKGEVVVMYPADREYSVKDVEKVISPIVSQDARMVLGTRAYEKRDLNMRLERVYQNNKTRYVISKYGGMVLSISILLLYRRFVSDPLTTVKAFDVRAFRGVPFECKGVDFDIELIVKLCKMGDVVYEVPVSYSARSIEEGKKTSVIDGVRALIAVWKFAFWRP